MDRTSAVVGGNAAYVYVLPNAPPYAPQNLQATAGDGQISLKWDANAEADFLRYRIYGGTTPNPTTKIDSVDGAANATKIIKNLITGTTYYFRITAVNMALQESGFSNEVSAVLTTDTPPAAPQGLTAIAGDRQITLKWRQNTEADFLRYRIYRGTSPNPITKVDSTNGIADTTKTFAGLTNGTRYYFRITAVDQNLNESGYSNEVSAIPFGDQFTKITTGAIVNDGGESRGCSWADYDNDGDLDLLVTNREQNNVLYSNNGNGTFAKITQSVIFTDGGNSRGISWGDYDNDGYIDIFIGNHYQKSYLYHNNGNGTFTKVTSGAIVNDEGIPYNVSWGDYDNDGDLDLFVANCCGRNNFLYSNNGNGTFTKITQGAIVNDGGNSISANWVDYDNDGDLDLFVTNGDVNVPYNKNFLYTNNGDGTFTKVTQGAIMNDQGNFWSSSWGDYDNDGDLDLFVATIDNQNNLLYTNNGDGTFTKVTSGDIVNNGAITFGSSWGDYDNDGDLDLFVTRKAGTGNLLYNNNGDGTFTKVTAGVVVNEGSNSGSCAWGDYDKDGDLDLFVANTENENNFLYSNNGNTNRWINIKCVGTVSNASAIGAKVRIKARIKGKPVWQMQEISGQTGLTSQNSLNAEFGLGDATQIDSIKIEWPSRIVQVLVNVSVNQFLTITEPSDKPLAPRNLRATAGDRQITLTWTANSEADFLRYRIYGGTSPNPAALVDSVQGSANTSKTLTGLSNGTTYFYRLTAVDLALNASGFSNEVSATPSATDLPPAPPQNLAATAGVAQVTLTWNANTETDFLRYRIYGGTAANPTTKIDSVEGAANTSKTIANLTPGTTYYFWLTAVDRAMHASGFSNIATAAPVADKTAPVLGSAAYARTANLNSEVQVAISASDISGLKNISVHYRAGGAASFSSKPMLLQSGSTYSQTIPAAAVTNRGVEFYVRAEDTYSNVAQTGLHPIRVYCPNGIANPAGQPSGKEASLYRLFSIPLELDNPSPATFLSANPSLGAYDEAKYRWYGLERATQSLREYPNFGSIAMTPDMGFALLVNIRNVKLKTSSGTTVVTTAPYNISLPAGWSLIGNPFNFNIPFDSLRVSFGAFELWSFEGDWQINTRGLEPWKGYAIWLSDAATFSIRPGVAGLNTGTAFYSMANNDAENWLLQIIADNGRGASRFNFAGQSAGASDNEDALDLHQPVRLADGIEVVFTKKNSASLKADIRQPSTNGHTWEFTCRLNPEDEMLSLTFDGVATVPQAFDIFLLEPETATAYDLRANPRLQFATRHLTEKRFQLVAGTKAYLHEQALPAELHPASFELLQNFPNPFNPSTQIIYSLPEVSHVEVSVHNIRGERVATLVNERQESGSHTVVWNAEKVGSGVYFIRMRAGSFETVNKCLFIK
ncbi:FG-GAP-like repeat-containing protein [candidate division KSB1 bacterium]|nr:FG-GAP-like repeat-containing protein [candidate division KSB1 bacterium]